MCFNLIESNIIVSQLSFRAISGCSHSVYSTDATLCIAPPRSWIRNIGRIIHWAVLHHTPNGTRDLWDQQRSYLQEITLDALQVTAAPPALLQPYLLRRWHWGQPWDAVLPNLTAVHGPMLYRKWCCLTTNSSSITCSSPLCTNSDLFSPLATSCTGRKYSAFNYALKTRILHVSTAEIKPWGGGGWFRG